MDYRDQIENLNKENFASLLDYLNKVMELADAEHLLYARAIIKNRRIINKLKKDNAKMTDREKKIFGRKNNKMIKEAEKNLTLINRNLALCSPENVFNSKCEINGYDPIKTRALLSEKRGWSVISLLVHKSLPF